jgi:predicted O-methyltransferase YrrM
MPDLAVLIPTRGRPDNIRKVVKAWDFTGAWGHAHMFLIADADDPEIEDYRVIQAWANNFHPGLPVQLVIENQWRPMVHKLDRVARNVAYQRTYRALAFAGDDHLPRTIGWAKRYLDVLAELGTGMVYGDDGYQGSNLSTEWAVTADAVRELDQMVPADVEHMYCDNSIMELFAAAGALRHLPEVTIEHMHPIVGKAPSDDQYARVNHRDQFKRDRAAYELWKRTEMHSHVAAIRQLRSGRPDVPPPNTPKIREVKRVPRSPFPHFFKRVVGATPHDIEITLADFAAQVPADQEIVELGVYHGRTALIMAWGASQGHGAHVTGIDPWDLRGNTYGPPFTTDAPRKWAHHHVQSLGYSTRITLVQAFSLDQADRWHDPEVAVNPVGLLFVDGDHSYDGARGDIEVWSRHLAPGAVIAVDDYGHPDWPGVKMAVDDLVDEGFLQPVEIYHDRLAVTRLAIRPDWENGDDDPEDGPTTHGVEPGTGRVITSEGVTPSPESPVETEPGCLHPECTLDHPHAGPAVLAAPSVMPFGEVLAPDFEPLDTDVSEEQKRVELEAEWERADPEGVAELRASAAAMDERESLTEQEKADLGTHHQVIVQLNLAQLKALAKLRHIVLGTRKDKRDAILKALREGA